MLEAMGVQYATYLQHSIFFPKEKERLMAIVQQREKEMKKQREAQAALNAKIKVHQTKMLCAGCTPYETLYPLVNRN